MNFRSLLLPGLVVFSAWPAPAAEPSAPPNILFILADDAGYHDFGFQDNPALEKLTPNLDRLRQEGVRFTNAYANASICAPSRAAILTGRYPHRFGFQQNYPESDSELFQETWKGDAWKKMGMDLTEKTVGDHLKANGYITAVIGKWHQGYDDAFHPNRRGFDEFWGLRGGSRSYFPKPEFETASPPASFDRIEANHELVPESQLTYVTDDLSQAAIRFLDAHRTHPFFLYLSYTAPHLPLEGRPEDVRWVEKNYPGLEPKRIQTLALLRRLDHGIGEVLDHLKKLNLTKNTVVIFAVDNGGSIRGLADNTPFRGYKYSPFEGGLRVPLLVAWPGVITPGGTIREPVMLCDLTPTFVEIAGGKTADQAKPFDGSSIVPLLREKNGRPADSLAWREINSAGATKITRQGPYKLILIEGKPPELYNVEDDPGEKRNLAEHQADIVEKLTAVIQEWEKGMSEPRWYQY